MDGKKRKFIICHADGGRFGASVIRAAPGMSSWGGWHSHDLDFQMVHAAGCWFLFEYEGEGAHFLPEGSHVLLPPGIGHWKFRHRSDAPELAETACLEEFAAKSGGMPE